ncbi:anhydro-N-acetylmuramic acid kinase [Mangrovibacterium lignilyticum]|uniref:anhydro-N-acetylmuramic acid kinase n=1 Tax=Mangrovibacterium lignilyticum TaxID=2668052 RepID=UPI0013D2CB5A|nr:anhydro-N-acetylmuramic acid kinase [Mangrovibacterium lignilyticum]
MEYYIGIMSGTSLDGIDAILVSFKNQQIHKIESHSQAFPDDLKKELDQLICTYLTDLQKIGEMDHYLALCYADAVNNLLKKAAISQSQITAIGCHGQTVFHSPETKHRFTMQLGDGNLIAAKTGIKTITDFRRMDMAFGGGGAPLAPAFHQAYLNSTHEKRCILNLGGIANITLLAENDDDVLGFDTGPANCLMDSWTQKIKGEKFDNDGTWARSGTIVPELLTNLLAENYFQQPAPKTTGRELFNLNWLENHLKAIESYSESDVQATLLELTAQTIAKSIIESGKETDVVYACGGGAYNSFLLERISFNLNYMRVVSTDELAVPPQWVESIAFAWLAMRRMKNQYGNLPSVTGASQKALLGTIHDTGVF